MGSFFSLTIAAVKRLVVVIRMSQVAFTVFSHAQFLIKFFKLANENLFKKQFLTKASKVSFIGNGCDQLNGAIL